MKPGAFRSLQRVVIVGMLAGCAATARAADDLSSDPIVGKWLFEGHVRKFNADGTCKEKDIYGTWRHVDDADATHRKYVVEWKKWVDTLYLKTDGSELKGANRHGRLVIAKRLD